MNKKRGSVKLANKISSPNQKGNKGKETEKEVTKIWFKKESKSSVEEKTKGRSSSVDGDISLAN